MMALNYRKQGNSLIVFGHTFPHKEKIKAIGGRFDGLNKTWIVPFSDHSLAKLMTIATPLTDEDQLGDQRKVTSNRESDGIASIWAERSGEHLLQDRRTLTNDRGDDGMDSTWAESSASGGHLQNSQNPSIFPGGDGNRSTDLKVSQLMQRIQSSLESAFPSAVWVTGEIQNFNNKAQATYFQLAEERGQNQRGASLSVKAVIWADTLLALKAKHTPKALEDIFQEDMQVRLLCRVNFYKERGQVSLFVMDLDLQFTKGALALARERTLQELRAQGLDKLNARTPLPKFPLTLGLISAESSRAYGDFVDQLRSLGFPGKLIFAQTPMQGESTPKKVIANLKRLESLDVDLIVITRGGGSSADLRWFDDKDIAVAIAHCQVPVICAIGHHQDVVISEEVCFQRQKTPTAAADFVLELFRLVAREIDEFPRVLNKILTHHFEHLQNALTTFYDNLSYHGHHALELRQKGLDEVLREGQLAIERRVLQTENALESAHTKLFSGVALSLGQRNEGLLSLEKELVKHDPLPWIAQGFTQLRHSETKEIIKSLKDVALGQRLSSRLLDGTLDLKVSGKR